MSAQDQQVAKSFVDYYYATFDRNRQELLPLYVARTNVERSLDVDF